MTPYGPFCLRVMTFRFANAPLCFQWYMDKVFAPLLYKNLENYLDNVLNHHWNKADHVRGVQDTLQYLWEAGLFCNPKQCKFHQSKIEFLGMDISQNGFKMDEKKTSTITAWECPTSVQGVREFISCVNFFQRWILGFSDIAHPLHNLFQKN